MNKFKYYFIVLVTTLFLFSCSKNDLSYTAEPLRDYSVQYTADNSMIEDYLKTYYFTVTNHPGFSDDQDIVFTKIPSGGSQNSIWSCLNSTTFPKLLSRDVNFHGIIYKVYYLVLREGTGEKPTNVDAVLASYRGDYLGQIASTSTASAYLTVTKFEETKYPQRFFGLTNTILGWSEIFPQFRTGTYTANNVDGTVSYSDFGAGVMFVPSGLAYYASGGGAIPSYSPLVFSFKLYEVQRLDHDGDGIPSYLEDLNGDGYIYDFRNTTNYPTAPTTNLDDTDGDGIPNFYDADDDGDNYTTKLEIKDANGVVTPFAAIPDCSGNITSITRVKKYLDKNCH
jgi:hypothetical protein